MPVPSLIERNAQAIEASAAGSLQRSRLLASRAVLLTRHRHTRDAMQAMTKAQSAVDESGDAEASTLLLLARGIAAHHSDRSQIAIDAVREALAAAHAAGAVGLQADCEAWLASILWHRLDLSWEDFLAHLRRAILLGLTHNKAAAARGFCVAGCAYQAIAMMPIALAHYRRSMNLAREVNDEQLVASVHRYMALAQVKHARRAHAAGRLDRAQHERTMAGLLHANDLTAALSKDEASVQTVLQTAEMLRIEGDDTAAIALFAQYLPLAREQGTPPWGTVVARSDWALSLARTGRAPEAEAMAEEAATTLRLESAHLDNYTQAVALGTLGEVAQCFGADDAWSLERRAQALWSRERETLDGFRHFLLSCAPLGE
jgi:tetratricopeptide (TPR) repeat protein